MKSIIFRRKSVCMGDDVNNGAYTIKMPDSATLGDLLNVVLHGGNGNDWPIPYTGANSFWVIKTNIGKVADIYTDSMGEWHIDYCNIGKNTKLSKLDIEWVFGDRE